MSKWRGFFQTFVLIFSLSTSVFLLYDIGSYKSESVRLSSEIISLEKKLDVKAGNWLYHIERRINSSSKSQDEYVITIHERINDIDRRLQSMEKRTESRGDNNKPVNQANNTQNIYIGRDYPAQEPEDKYNKKVTK